MWNALAHGCAHAKELLLFFEGSTKLCGRVGVPESSHRIVALFDSTMVLFNVIVQIWIAPMHDLFAQRFTNCSRIRVMPVGRHPFWCLLGDLQRIPQKAFGRIHIPVFTEHRIDEIPITINGSVEIIPGSANANVGFVAMPGPTSLSLPLGSEFVTEEWSETTFPVAHGFMSEFKASFQKHFSKVTKVQVVVHAPGDDQKNDVGWEFEIIERGARTLVELTPTCGTPKGAVAHLSSIGQSCRCRGRAVRANHRILPGKLDSESTG
jgi:hypothetical protein